MDIVSPARRSQMMAGIRSANTHPEIIVRRLLHAHGFRYRLHKKILDLTPDIILPKYKLIIFVNGCFWHRHNNCNYAYNPKTNVQKWESKFANNINRDLHNKEMLLDSGWNVVVIWECWVKRRLDISWLFSWIKTPERPYISWPDTAEPF